MADSTIQKWTVLKEEDVSPSHWFPLLKHTVKLPGGLIVDDYFFAPLGDVVMVIAITTENDVVMVRQYKHGISQITLEIPGGMQQAGKDIVQSALNELEEETGIKATADKLIPLGKIANNTTKTRQVTYGFILFEAVINTVQKPDVTENIQIVKVPAHKLIQMVLNEEIWTTDSVSFILKAALLYPQIFNHPA
jgi:ADP-ribose pyrophosphatase